MGVALLTAGFFFSLDVDESIERVRVFSHHVNIKNILK